MNRRIETALRSKYNFRKQCPKKETNELCAQGYCVDIISIGPSKCIRQHLIQTCVREMRRYAGSNERVVSA